MKSYRITIWLEDGGECFEEIQDDSMARAWDRVKKKYPRSICPKHLISC